MIAALIGDIWPYVIAAIGAGAGLFGIYAKGRSDAKAKVRNEALKADAKATERMNDAPTLRNASDTDRVEWLRGFADRNRRD